MSYLEIISNRLLKHADTLPPGDDLRALLVAAANGLRIVQSRTDLRVLPLNELTTLNAYLVAEKERIRRLPPGEARALLFLVELFDNLSDSGFPSITLTTDYDMEREELSP